MTDEEKLFFGTEEITRVGAEFVPGTVRAFIVLCGEHEYDAPVNAEGLVPLVNVGQPGGPPATRDQLLQRMLR